MDDKKPTKLTVEPDNHTWLADLRRDVEAVRMQDELMAPFGSGPVVSGWLGPVRVRVDQGPQRRAK